MRWLRVTLTLLALAATTLLVFDLAAYFVERDRAFQEARIRTADQAMEAASMVNAELTHAVRATQRVAAALSSREQAGGSLAELLKQELAEAPQVTGLGVAYVPRMARSERSCENRPNYRCRDDIGEREAKEIRRGELVEVASTPISYEDDESGSPTVAGRVYADYSRRQVAHLLEGLELDRSGYAFLVDGEGRLLAHPVEEYVSQELTLYRLAALERDPALLSLAERITLGGQHTLSLRSQTTGLSSWSFVEPIAATGWTLAVVVAEHDVPVDTDMLRRKLMRCGIWVLLLLLALTGLLTGVRHGRSRSLWALVQVASVGMVVLIGFYWHLTGAFPPTEKKRAVPLLDRTAVDHLVDRTTAEYGKLGQAAPRFVPAGFFLQSLRLVDANTFHVTGYVWVHHLKGVHDGLRPGVVFPDLLNEEDLSLEPAYVKKTESGTVTGYNVRALLRGVSDYRRYPFDQRRIKVRIWHRDFARNAVLVPDLSSYPFTNPSSLPGLASGLTVPGWQLLASGFEHAQAEYLTSFGIPDARARKNFPEMRFTVQMERFFLDAFVSNVIPMLVIVLLLFIIMLASSREGSVMEVLGACGAFFFTVILAHVSLRDDLATHAIVYFEQFYFIMYFVILFVALNGLLRGQKRPPRLVAWRNNLLPMLTYWPIVLGVATVLTFVVFY